MFVKLNVLVVMLALFLVINAYAFDHLSEDENTEKRDGRSITSMIDTIINRINNAKTKYPEKSVFYEVRRKATSNYD